jgi:hypothetical protein
MPALQRHVHENNPKHQPLPATDPGNHQMASKRPDYEALDAQGYPYMREAKVVGELPLADCRPALDAALAPVSNALGMPALKALSFGLPVLEAFGINHREAARHEQAKLLLTQGTNLSLDFVPSYTSASV